MVAASVVIFCVGMTLLLFSGGEGSFGDRLRAAGFFLNLQAGLGLVVALLLAFTHRLLIRWPEKTPAGLAVAAAALTAVAALYVGSFAMGGFIADLMEATRDEHKRASASTGGQLAGVALSDAATLLVAVLALIGSIASLAPLVRPRTRAGEPVEAELAPSAP